MKNWFLVCLIGSVSCSTPQPRSGIHGFMVSEQTGLTIGKSNQKEILDQYGPPQLELEALSGNRVFWKYYDSTGKNRLNFVFNKDSKSLQSVYWFPGHQPEQASLQNVLGYFPHTNFNKHEFTHARFDFALRKELLVDNGNGVSIQISPKRQLVDFVHWQLPGSIKESDGYVDNGPSIEIRVIADRRVPPKKSLEQAN